AMPLKQQLQSPGANQRGAERRHDHHADRNPGHLQRRKERFQPGIRQKVGEGYGLSPHVQPRPQAQDREANQRSKPQPRGFQAKLFPLVQSKEHQQKNRQTKLNAALVDVRAPRTRPVGFRQMGEPPMASGYQRGQQVQGRFFRDMTAHERISPVQPQQSTHQDTTGEKGNQTKSPERQEVCFGREKEQVLNAQSVPAKEEDSGQHAEEKESVFAKQQQEKHNPGLNPGGYSRRDHEFIPAEDEEGDPLHGTQVQMTFGVGEMVVGKRKNETGD